MNKLKITSLLLLLFFLPPTSLKNTAFLTINDLSIAGFELKNIQLFLLESSDHHTEINGSVSRLTAPELSDGVVINNIYCSRIVFSVDALTCLQGRGQLSVSGIYETVFDFFLRVSETQNELKLTSLADIERARFIQTLGRDGASQLDINLQGVTSGVIKPLLPSYRIDWAQGTMDVEANMMFSKSGLTDLHSNFVLKSVSIQTDDGRYASEELDLATVLDVTMQQQWRWQIQTEISHGEIYLEPVYHASPEQPLVFTANGLWDVKNKELKINEFIFDDPVMGHLAGHSRVKIDNSIKVEQATLSFNTENLQLFERTYVQPFLAESLFEGITVTGGLDAQVDFSKQSINKISLKLTALNLVDPKERIHLQNGRGTINWSSQLAAQSQSVLAWDRLFIYQLPIGPAELVLTTDQYKIKLTHPLDLPILGGNIHVSQFDWLSMVGQDPVTHFQGTIERISLGQLATILKWPDLHGTISGGIPQITYHQGEIKTSGELWVEVFGGYVRVNKLVLANFLSAQPEVFADVEVDNLDLQQISQTFKAGKITGKLSGFINDLHLLAWQPVTFFAWLGTPENDSSKHEISQRALDNIASIGSGPGVGLLSTTFLRYFDLFGYDKLGMGCYLHQGVCQLMGINAVNEGFYLVKGQGLPRVDVIAYNTQLDFNVLLKRLERITQAEF